jgi:hypothetical protein
MFSFVSAEAGWPMIPTWSGPVKMEHCGYGLRGLAINYGDLEPYYTKIEQTG